MKTFLMIVVLSVLLSGISIGTKSYKFSSEVLDFVVDNEQLTACTSSGTVEMLSLHSGKIIRKVHFPKIKDFTGALQEPEVFKIVRIQSTFYVLVHGEGGYNDIYRIQGGQTQKIIAGKSLGSIAIALAVSKDKQLIIGLLSNEIIKYHLQKHKMVYRSQTESYALSDMTTSTDRQWLFVADESGVIQKVRLADGQVVQRYSGQHVDKVLSIDYAAGMLVSGGKDRRIGVYNTLTQSAYHFSTNSFVGAISISPSGKTIAWYDDINNSIVVYQTDIRQEITRLSGHQSTVNKLRFIDEHHLMSCSNDHSIIQWNL